MKPCLLLWGSLVLVSCTLDYGERLADELDDIPNSILQDFRLSSVRENRVVFRLKADLIESNNSRREDKVSEVSIEEFDTAGELRISGTAATGVISQGTRDANLTEVEMYSRENETRITADSLSWTDSLRQLKSGPLETVRIERGDGTVIEGIGFSADFNSATLSFEGEVSGFYHEGDDENEERTP